MVLLANIYVNHANIRLVITVLLGFTGNFMVGVMCAVRNGQSSEALGFSFYLKGS